MKRSALNWMRTGILLPALLTLATVGMTETAEKFTKEIMVDRWIVELVDPPTLSYEGPAALTQSARQATGKTFAATAPSVTGRARFDVAAPEVVSYAAYLDQQRGVAIDDISAALGRQIVPIHEFRHVANGFSVRMSAAEAAALAGLASVKSVEPVQIFQPETDEGPRAISAPSVWAGFSGIPAAQGEGIVIGIIDSGINWNSNYFSDDPAIAGYDYTNPLGSQLGLCSDPEVMCNDKLIGVYDHTTEGTKGFDSQGHGSHVASIAAGNPVSFSGYGRTFATSGVAPRANIISYKVCYDELPDDPDRSGCPGDALTAGLEQALEDGVHVVNYSIGGGAASPWTQSRRLLNFWSAGIPFVTSAGNSGPEAGSISAPANAPWAFSVGSTSHRRWISRRATFSGGFAARMLLYGTGPELETTLTARPIRVADEFASDRLGCSSFPSGSFAGAVALIERGQCTFETKVNNASDAGASAVLVFNNDAGLPIIMGQLEGTSIPSAMMGRQDGLDLVAFIDNSGNPDVTLGANEASNFVPAFANLVTPYSSRGPGRFSGNVMKPNAVAPGGLFLGGGSPGSAIIGAGIPDSDSLLFMQGTSMASPNAAGAIALLRQIHPGWTPDILQSTLETTAVYEGVNNNGIAANQIERGAGRIRVDRAARAGLFLPITRDEFLDANPAEGGDPGALNLAGIFDQQCLDTCSTVRTVEALTAGSWEVSTIGELDIQVSPSSFTLAVGQRQQLQITYGAEDQSAGGVIDGRIILSPITTGMVEQSLAVGIMAVETVLPDSLSLSAPANRGSASLGLEAVEPLPEAVFPTSPLVLPELHEFELAQDPTRNDPFSGGEGTKTFLVDVPENTLILFAETIFSTAPDIDLFVGRDANGNGQADESELVCASTSPDELERCLIKQPQPGTWWVVVQNWQATSATAEDEVELEVAILTADQNDYSLVANGPGFHPGGPLNLQVTWDEPAIRRNQRWLGAIGISSTPDSLADIGILPLFVTREADNTPRPTALLNGETLPVVMPPGTSHELLFIDVPPGTQQLRVHVDGEPGVNAVVRAISYDDLAGAAPGTPVADSEDLASGSGSGDGYELLIGESDQLVEPARYAIVLDNTSTQERMVHVTAELTEGERLDPRFGLWSPESRLIFQGIEWQQAGQGFIVWYAYDRLGMPVFYIASGEVDENSSVWKGNLLRVTSDRQRQTVNSVGEVALTTINSERMVFSWRLNGAHGSEIMTPDAPQTCPEVGGSPASYSGHWFSPEGTVGGTTVISTSSNDFFVRYFFDDDGVGRWVIVPGFEADQALEVREFRGFCPNCPEEELSFEGNSEPVGVYGVSFDSESTGVEIMDITLGAPLNHDIMLDVPIQKLSERLECHN
jgi:subtilisin family serine protease